MHSLDNSPGHAQRLPQPAPGTASGPRRILVVDDDPLNQMLAVAFLQNLGYTEIDTAADGHEALAACARGGISLVLMDCLMPGMNGRECSRRLRAGGFAAPIVALTADTDPQDVQRCLEAGMSDHLPKPLDFQRMAATVQRWAGDSQGAAIN